MFRLYLPIAFGVIFILWILYRGLIIRDLKKHKSTVWLGLFFCGVWAVIYLFVLK